MLFKKGETMEWLKKHADTIASISVFAICFWTLNEKMNDRFSKIETELAVIKTEIAVIKTVLIIKNIMPSELAKNDVKKPSDKIINP